jgi:hypothetical protein
VLAAAPLPLLPDLLGERVSPMKGRWFQRDLPYSWDFFIENVLDPTHVSGAVRHLLGVGARRGYGCGCSPGTLLAGIVGTAVLSTLQQPCICLQGACLQTGLHALGMLGLVCW